MDTDGTSGEEINRPVYTLGIAAELSKIPTHSIRQYIDRGLLLPYKLKSNRHLFSRNDIERLRQIHYLIHEKGLNFAGIRTLIAMMPCWAIRKCPVGERHKCDAFSVDFTPCWESSNKGRICKNEDCRECAVYTSIVRSGSLKQLLHSVIVT